VPWSAGSRTHYETVHCPTSQQLGTWTSTAQGRLLCRSVRRRFREIQGLARRRIIFGTIVGGIALVIAALAGASWSVAVLLGWVALVLVFLQWVWLSIINKDASQTQKLALAEDDSRAAADLVVLGASIASLVAVVFTLSEAAKSSGVDGVLLALLAVTAVVLSWAAIQTTFTLMYARLYYGDPEGGIDFPGDRPDYRDFAYMAFTIGMTYQVSDTSVGQKRIRHVVTRHALLSFVFGTTIIAVAINAVANLIK
jgi:uncharacterized membrane protein